MYALILIETTAINMVRNREICVYIKCNNIHNTWNSATIFDLLIGNI